MLYVQGLTEDMPGYSGHEFGQACDIFHADWHADMPDICWKVLGHIGEEIALNQGTGVLWGGLPRPYHWEIL